MTLEKRHYCLADKTCFAKHKFANMHNYFWHVSPSLMTLKVTYTFACLNVKALVSQIVINIYVSECSRPKLCQSHLTCIFNYVVHLNQLGCNFRRRIHGNLWQCNLNITLFRFCLRVRLNYNAKLHTLLPRYLRGCWNCSWANFSFELSSVAVSRCLSWY